MTADMSSRKGTEPNSGLVLTARPPAAAESAIIIPASHPKPPVLPRAASQMATPEGSEHSDEPSREHHHYACLPCSLLKKKCEQGSDGDAFPCARCMAYDFDCVPQSKISKKAKNQLKATLLRATKLPPQHPQPPSKSSSASTNRSSAKRGSFDSLASDGPSTPSTANLKPLDPAAGRGKALQLPAAIGDTPKSQPETVPSFAPRVPNLQAPAAAPPPLPTISEEIVDVSILACVEGFFTYDNVAQPLIHHDIYNRALTPPSPIYGAHRPVALTYALAACGARHANLPGLSDLHRLALANELLERAKTALLANYFGNAPSATHLEAAQTLFLTYQYSVVEGVAAQAHAVLQGTAEVLTVLIAELPCLAATDSAGIATNPVDWVQVEMIRRLWLALGFADSGMAHMLQRKMLLEYLERPITLPAHDRLFLRMSAHEAFAALYVTRTSFAPPTVDLRPLLLDPTNLPLACQAVRSLISSIFANQTGYMSLVMTMCLIRKFRNRVMDFAKANGLDQVTLASKTGLGQDTLVEATYRHAVGVIDEMVAEVCRAMPQDIGLPLAEGNSLPLLTRASTFFAEPGQGEAFVGSIVFLKSLTIENWMQGAPTRASEGTYFASTPMRAVLESAYVSARIMEGHLQYATAPLRFNTQISVIGALRVGFLDLAAVSMFRSTQAELNPAAMEIMSGIEYDVKVVLRYLEAIAEVYKAGVKIARDFRANVVASGIRLDEGAEGGSVNVGEMESFGGAGSSGLFTRVAQTSETWIKAIARYGSVS